MGGDGGAALLSSLFTLQKVHLKYKVRATTCSVRAVSVASLGAVLAPRLARLVTPYTRLSAVAMQAEIMEEACVVSAAIIRRPLPATRLAFHTGNLYSK